MQIYPFIFCQLYRHIACLHYCCVGTYERVFQPFMGILNKWWQSPTTDNLHTKGIKAELIQLQQQCVVLQPPYGPGPFARLLFGGFI